MANRFEPQVFFRELASMLRSGIALPEALTFSAESFPAPVRHRLDQVRDQVTQGQALSEALSLLPEAWAPKVLRATVAAGERCGRLPELLEELAREQERLAALNRRVRAVLVYPLAVLAFAGMTLYPIMQSLPVLRHSFSKTGTPFPWPVDLLVRLYPVLGLLAIIITVVLIMIVFSIVKPSWAGSLSLAAPQLRPFKLLARVVKPIINGLSRLGTMLVELTTIWLPMLRGLRRALLEVRFARTLGVLIAADVPLDQALELCRDVVGDQRAGHELIESAAAIRDGTRPSEALHGLQFLSPAFLWFIAGSEHRGDFVEVVSAMAETAEERFLTRLEAIERVLEPAGTVVVGVIVGSMVVALYHAMYSLVGAVGS
jgi:general secretion pathway protein F